jgi:hypothetical protein
VGGVALRPHSSLGRGSAGDRTINEKLGSDPDMNLTEARIACSRQRHVTGFTRKSSSRPIPADFPAVSDVLDQSHGSLFPCEVRMIVNVVFRRIEKPSARGYQQRQARSLDYGGGRNDELRRGLVALSNLGTDFS